MTEHNTQLLTYNNIPGKVVLNAIHFLDKFEKPGETVPPPSLGVALVDITGGIGKRKRYEVDEKTSSQKLRCVEGDFLSMKEDGVDRPDII